MAVDTHVRQLSVQELTNESDTRDMLAHAARQARERNFSDYFIVDVDAHINEGPAWRDIIAYIEDPVHRHNAEELDRRGTMYQVYTEGGTYVQNVIGRIVDSGGMDGRVEAGDAGARYTTLARRAMDTIGIDAMVLFPSMFLQLGLTHDIEAEAQLAYAYDRWFTETVLSEEPRIMSLLYLPMGDPDQCLRIIREFGGKKGVIGFMITSLRHQPVHDNAYIPIYRELEDRQLPLAFHAGPTWRDRWMQTVNRFAGVHAISFVLCNQVHLSNWILNGLPERFPNLKVIWVESGLAWVPFMMQRLDHEFLMRQSDAPLLRRLPSDYMREMYYTTQPLERQNLDLLAATFKAINGSTQLLYASDWPHWDRDFPAALYDLPFLDETAKRSILGENARRLFRL